MALGRLRLAQQRLSRVRLSCCCFSKVSEQTLCTTCIFRWGGLPFSVEGCEEEFKKYYCAFTPEPHSSVVSCEAVGKPLPAQINVLFRSLNENAASLWFNKKYFDGLSSEQLGDVEKKMGNIGNLPDEVKFLIKYAKQPDVVNICEVGFAAGHSGSVMLWANPTAILHSFDDESLPWAAGQLEYVNNSFFGRVRRFSGDSAATLSAFSGECNLAFIGACTQTCGVSAALVFDSCNPQMGITMRYPALPILGTPSKRCQKVPCSSPTT